MVFIVIKHVNPQGRRTSILVSEGTFADSPDPSSYVAGGGECTVMGQIDVTGEAADELDEIYHAERY